MKILIVTSGPLCRNPRALKEAQTLGAYGYEVTALTVANQASYEAFDDHLLENAPFRKVAVNLLAQPPRHRLNPLLERGLTWAARRCVRQGLETRQAFGPFRALRRAARQIEADLTLLHTEVALSLGRDLMAAGRRVAADFEDWHSQDLLPSAQSSRPLRLLCQIEGDLLQRAAYASAPSEAMAAALHAAYGGTLPIPIANVFPLQPPPKLQDRGTSPAFFWFSQTIGPARGLEEFLDAWSLTTSPSRVALLGEISPDYRESLRNRIPAHRQSLLEFLPVVAPADLPAIIARHDVGLALEPSIPRNKDLTISNKIFQYLNAGLCVVATGTRGQRAVLDAAPGAGVMVDSQDTAAFAATLESLLVTPAKVAAAGLAARRAAEEIFCWEREVPKLLQAVEAALATPTPKP